MPELKQIEVVEQTGALIAAGGIALIGLDVNGTLIWRGTIGRTGTGEETITWRQIRETPAT